MAFHLVGVDLGGTKIACALTDTDSTILEYETVPIDPASGPDVVVNEMAAVIRRVTSRVRPESILGVGVAIAGQVEPVSGRVLYSPNLNWHHVPLGEKLRTALGWEVYVGNDVALSALGEHHYGVARDHDDVVALYVGTGVGAGLILHGRLYQGAHGLAGEIGQTSIMWDGPACPAGNRGCLERYVSDPALRRRMREALAAGRTSSLATIAPEALRIEDLRDACEGGDALAREIVDEAGDILATAVANVINLLNPAMVVLGGGVLRGVPMLVPLIQAGARERALPGASRDCRIAPAQFGREGGVIGATVFAKLAGRVEAAPFRPT